MRGNREGEKLGDKRVKVGACIMRNWVGVCVWGGGGLLSCGSQTLAQFISECARPQKKIALITRFYFGLVTDHTYKHCGRRAQHRSPQHNFSRTPDSGSLVYRYLPTALKPIIAILRCFTGILETDRRESRNDQKGCGFKTDYCQSN